MAGEENIDRIILLGTGAMLFLALAVIVFIIIYQRRMFAKQDQINRIIIDNQKKLIEAEIDAKELEKKRIAQELHDDIGASLSSMRFTISALNHSVQGVSELEETLTRVTQKVREISNDLLPHVLSELGIRDALSNFLGQLRMVPIEFTFTFDDGEYANCMSKERQLALYRVVQELINNIMKYAEATHVHIDLQRSPVELMLRIEDDGNGRIPEQDARKHPMTLGLKNIQSRMDYVGGTIDRKRNQLGGTTVTILIPLT